MEENQDRQSATGWLIATYIFAILGGVIGLILGLRVFSAKEVLVNEEGERESVPKYKDSHRVIGLVGAILAGISTIIWKALI